jgi:hypothetical protein
MKRRANRAYGAAVRLRSVSSGWIRSAFFAVLALAVFLLFRRVMARSAFAYQAFALTFLALPALAVLEEMRRRSQRGGAAPRYEPAPAGAVYEPLLSPRALVWPLGIVLWILLPFAAIAGLMNFLVGQLTHNVAASMGSLVSVLVGTLGGLAAWLALRTLTVLSAGRLRGPLWREAPPPSLALRGLASERLFEPVYYYREEPPAG